jgi:hypothetical protein
MAAQLAKYAIDSDSDDVYNIVAMAGGKLDIPYEPYLEGCVGLKNNGATNCSYVFYIDQWCRAFFDVDNIGSLIIAQILTAIIVVANAQVFKLDVPLTVNDCFVTKNQIKENYHIYLNPIHASMATMNGWCALINKTLGFECIDPCLYSASEHAGLRIDGFNKFQRVEGSGVFVPNTAYYPIDPTTPLRTMFERIWPLSDGLNLTPLNPDFTAPILRVPRKVWTA